MIIFLTVLSLCIFSSHSVQAKQMAEQYPCALNCGGGNFAYKFVKVENHQLVADFDKDGAYDPYFIKGVGYGGVPIGWEHNWGYADPDDPRDDNIFNDPAILNRDFQLISQMNANTIRIWSGADTRVGTQFPLHITSTTLSKAEQYGLKVIAGFWMPWPGEWRCENVGGHFERIYYMYTDFTDPSVRQDIKDRFLQYVQSFQQSKTILFWAIGNENELGFDANAPENLAQIQAYFSLVNEMAGMVQFQPTAIVLADSLQFVGKSEFGTTDGQMNNLDIWGVNAYRGNTFGTLFDDYESLSSKPLWISEFGIDAFYADNSQYPGKGHEDQASQNSYDSSLWDDIVDHDNVTIGGTVFAYSDEWWKPDPWICGEQSRTCNSEQNHFGNGPVDYSCPQDGTIDWTPSGPDHFWHQEWYGIMSISPGANTYDPDVMTPRQIYFTLQNKWQ